ncbi:cytochrome P450 [Comamonas sp. JC664]|uniref:cytochrome P450 n=1 Tax=Comamonas sp. JC664 TaxID=2801917 RepID=UPI00174CEDCC|nr:cytochrome P450 [Comamonas sp. JC664]MBL0696314.1 cytochrome P450 [Comamonas sp. JC664]GHG66430.1 hypothetical protein GCM10012319_08510 [Comamonas sp. KCTC 72670]
MSRTAPGPEGHLLLGNAREFRDHPLDLMMRCRRQYGDVVRLRMGPVALHLVFNPEHVGRVLEGATFGRSDVASMFEPLLGGSMIIADGEPWRSQRQALAPTFARERLKQLAGRFREAAVDLVHRWEEALRRGLELDAQQEITRYALETMAIYLVGRRFDAQESADISRAWYTCLRSMADRLSAMVPLPAWLPTPSMRRLLAAEQDISRIILHHVQERRQELKPEDRGDFLSVLVHTPTPEGRKLTDAEILAEAKGLFLAGFDTVASAMSWTLHACAAHPGVQHRLREEVRAVARDASPLGGAVADMPYFRRVFNEAVRLNPPLWIVDRKAQEDVELGGFHIPKGSNIITCPYVTHRDPAYWEDPLVFDPDRFLPARSEGRPRYAHFPFGGGRMKCIGVGMAMMEAQILFTELLSRFRVELSPWRPVELEPTLVLRARAGLHLKLSLAGAEGPPITTSSTVPPLGAIA